MCFMGKLPTVLYIQGQKGPDYPLHRKWIYSTVAGNSKVATKSILKATISHESDTFFVFYSQNVRERTVPRVLKLNELITTSVTLCAAAAPTTEPFGAWNKCQIQSRAGLVFMSTQDSAC